MAEISYDKIMEPLLPDAPSGPDLDVEGDPAYWGFTSQLDVFLPKSYTSYDRAEKPVADHVVTALSLLKRTVDLRLLVALAKLSILDQKFLDFERTISTIAVLMESRWDDIHPQMNEMNEGMRYNALISLDDLPHVILPLQQAPLFRSKRLGAVTIRMRMLADQEIEAREASDNAEAEKVPSDSDFRASTDEASAGELTAVYEASKRLAGAVKSIQSIYAEKTGDYGAFSLKRLESLSARIAVFLDATMAAKGLIAAPSAQPAGSDSAAAHMPDTPAAAGSVRTMPQAARALDAAAHYFFNHEPSSPSRLLLAQARALMGKSLFDALQELVPDYASKAAIALGRDFPVSLPIEKLVTFLPPETPSLEEDEQPEGAEEPVVTDWNTHADNDPEMIAAQAESDEMGSPDDPAGDDAAAAGTSGEPSVSEAEDYPSDTPPEAAEEDAAPAHVPDEHSEPGAARPGARGRVSYAAKTRAEAIALIESVIAFYRVSEPSSPVPQLLDSARSNAGIDFAQVLKSVLPELYLRVDE